MIIDHDETQRIGKVVSLMERGSGPDGTVQEERVVEKTLALPVVSSTPPTPQPKPYEPPPAPSPRDPNPREPLPPLDPRPFRPGGQFVPAGPCVGLTLYAKPVPVVKTLAESVGVVQESADTGTHALPAIIKITGKPSGAVDMHRSAARVQQAMRHLGVAVWYGEHTREFWVMDSRGLHSFADVTTMYQGMGWQNL